MAARLSAFCLILAVSGAYAAHLVNFNSYRTLPQKRECDDACMERRMQDLMPMVRRFLASVDGKVARKLHEHREQTLRMAARNIANVMEDTKRKRAVDIFGREMMALKQVDRGIIKEGLHEQPLGRAANLVKRTVEEKVERNQRQADMVRQVRALINNLEERSQDQTQQANHLSQRALDDLNSAMDLEKRAQHVREVLEHNQQERAMHQLRGIKRSAAVIKESEKDAIKRGLDTVKDVTKRFHEREAKTLDMKRTALFGELHHFASRALQDKVNSLAKRGTDTLETKRAALFGELHHLASRRVQDKINNLAKRESATLEMKRSELLGELKHMASRALNDKVNNIAKREIELLDMKRSDILGELQHLASRALQDKVDSVAKRQTETLEMKRAALFGELHHFASRKLQDKIDSVAKRELVDKARRNIAYGLANSKRALDERKFEDAKELVTRKIANEIAATKRALDGVRLQKDRELRGMKISDKVAEVKRDVMKRKLQEAVKRDEEKSNLEEKRELRGMKVAAQMADAKRLVEKRKLLEERNVHEVQFSGKLNGLKRLVEESRAERLFKALETYRRSMGQDEQHLLARRALEGVKVAVEKSVSKREAEIEELEAVLGIEAAEAAEEKAPETYRRSMGQDEQHLLARRALEGVKVAVEKSVSKREAEIEELEAVLGIEAAEAAEEKSKQQEVELSRDKDYLDIIFGSNNYGDNGSKSYGSYGHSDYNSNYYYYYD